jgi:predicted MPP superfamily phosphohydrolase
MNKIPSFIIFFTTFLFTYGLLHFYLYIKTIRAFEMRPAWHILFILVLLFLLFSPVLTNICIGSEYSLPLNILAYAAYFWMSVLFLFFSIHILIDIYRVVVHISSRVFSPVLLRYIPEQRITFIIVLLIIAGINIYGWFEAGSIRVERISLNSSKVPSEMVAFRVVQLSDTHFSLTGGIRLARKINKIVKELEPDLVVSSGDLIERGARDVEEIAALLRDIDAPYGKFATTGNHEFIAGMEASSEFTEKAGFRLLRNESVEVGDFLNIAAIDDPAGERFGNEITVPEERVLETLSPDRISIFLKHQPRIEEKSIGKFDIQLSGHTHKGQIFPFTLIVSLFYPYMDGIFDLGDGSYLYVSRGTGTWGPPIRFLAFPEVAVIDFCRSED